MPSQFGQVVAFHNHVGWKYPHAFCDVTGSMEGPEFAHLAAVVVIDDAHGINDSGQIPDMAFATAKIHDSCSTPTPEPTRLPHSPLVRSYYGDASVDEMKFHLFNPRHLHDRSNLMSAALVASAEGDRISSPLFS